MADPLNLLVFRNTRERIATDVLRRELCLSSERTAQRQNDDETLDALIRAGELECGLEDCQWPDARKVCALTDALAGFLLHSSPPTGIESPLRNILAMPLPEHVEVSPPEGFAYYALHPQDFTRQASQLDAHESYAIIGIRSIGTVLSAVWLAGLHRCGVRASRTTVRPFGHPYDRVTEFNVEQIRWIDQQRSINSRFVVVDEGPGLSGSSFLSVGEALVQHGIPTERITFWGTRAPEPEKLCSPEAAKRSLQFRWQCVNPNFYTRLNHGRWLGGGNWRASLLQDGFEWPACWPQMERLKFFSEDEKHLLKFDGLGRFGERARCRAISIADSGFGPPVQDAGNGLSAYDFIAGKPLWQGRISSDLIGRIARYCAYRHSEFRANSSAHSDLVEMLRFNIAQQLGVEVEIPCEALWSKEPVICDGRMQPYEWIERSEGKVFKVDACSHGDDHFFPGPCDIAWDLAGAIVEWDMGNEATELLLSCYARYNGDIPEKRIYSFLLAYAAFRLSYCKMAWAAMQDTGEEPRLQRAYDYYRQRLVRDLARAGYSHQSPGKHNPSSAGLCRSFSR